MTNPHSTPAHHAPEQMAEPDVIDIGSIVRYAIGLLLVTVISQIAMVFTFNILAHSTDAANPPRLYPLAVDGDAQRPPEPRLQGGDASPTGKLTAEPSEHNPGPRQALKELRDQEDAILAGYAWVDRNTQTVRIPVAEAMKLTLQRGLPAREAVAAPPSQIQEQGK